MLFYLDIIYLDVIFIIMIFIETIFKALQWRHAIKSFCGSGPEDSVFGSIIKSQNAEEKKRYVVVRFCRLFKFYSSIFESFPNFSRALNLMLSSVIPDCFVSF